MGLSLFGKMQEPHFTFPPSRPYAAKMYWRAMRHPSPIGIVPLATATWKKEKSKQQHFFGNSYTVPTPNEYVHQKLGLIIALARAVHLRDAKQGDLVPPTLPEDEDFVDESVDTLEDPAPDTDTPDETLTPTHLISLNNLLLHL